MKRERGGKIRDPGNEVDHRVGEFMVSCSISQWIAPGPPCAIQDLERVNQKKIAASIDSWSFLPKMRFWDILVVFRLDIGQISFNLVEMDLEHDSLPFALYDILARACAEVSRFLIFFRLSFFSFLLQ